MSGGVGVDVMLVLLVVVVLVVGMRFCVRKTEPRADEAWVVRRAEREVKN